MTWFIFPPVSCEYSPCPSDWMKLFTRVTNQNVSRENTPVLISCVQLRLLSVSVSRRSTSSGSERKRRWNRLINMCSLLLNLWNGKKKNEVIDSRDEKYDISDGETRPAVFHLRGPLAVIIPMKGCSLCWKRRHIHHNHLLLILTSWLRPAVICITFNKMEILMEMVRAATVEVGALSPSGRAVRTLFDIPAWCVSSWSVGTFDVNGGISWWRPSPGSVWK